MHGENRVQTEYFLYPKLGAGQMWQEVAEKIKKRGGIIELGAMVDSLVLDNNMLKKISYIKSNGKRVFEEADVVISTMPLSSLFANMTGNVPIYLRTIADGLKYRDCVIMGLCIKWPELSNGAVSIENFPAKNCAPRHEFTLCKASHRRAQNGTARIQWGCGGKYISTASS